jgi:hypothetical protein
MAEQPRKISSLRARGAVLIPHMRTVLIVSVVLAVVAMAWAFLRTPDATEPVTGAPAATQP